MGEVLLSIVSILVCGGICLFSKKLTMLTQILFALILVLGVFGFFSLRSLSTKAV